MAVEDSEMAEWIRQQIAILKQKVQETGLELDRCRQDQVRKLYSVLLVLTHSCKLTLFIWSDPIAQQILGIIALSNGLNSDNLNSECHYTVFLWRQYYNTFST